MNGGGSIATSPLIIRYIIIAFVRKRRCWSKENIWVLPSVRTCHGTTILTTYVERQTTLQPSYVEICQDVQQISGLNATPPLFDRN
jgi:hypothetical protein